MDPTLALRLGRADLASPTMNDVIIGNDGYIGSAQNPGNVMGDCSDAIGRGGLGILGVAVLGVMVFYVATRGRQA